MRDIFLNIFERYASLNESVTNRIGVGSACVSSLFENNLKEIEGIHFGRLSRFESNNEKFSIVIPFY